MTSTEITQQTMAVNSRQFFAALYPDLGGHYLEIRKLPGPRQVWCRSLEAAVQAAQDQERRPGLPVLVCKNLGPSPLQRCN